jgi:hypothetical protein
MKHNPQQSKCKIKLKKKLTKRTKKKGLGQVHQILRVGLCEQDNQIESKTEKFTKLNYQTNSMLKDKNEKYSIFFKKNLSQLKLPRQTRYLNHETMIT